MKIKVKGGQILDLKPNSVFKEGLKILTTSQKNEEQTLESLMENLTVDETIDLHWLPQDKLELLMPFCEILAEKLQDENLIEQEESKELKKPSKMLFQPFLDKITKFSDFTIFRKLITEEFPECTIAKDTLNQLFEFVNKSEKILVLHNLGGTIFYRPKKYNDVGQKKDLKINNKVIIRRPGHDIFLKTLNEHPRIQLACYSSMMAKNIQAYLDEIYSNDLQIFKEDAIIFDQTFTPLMKNNRKMKKFMQDPWDRFKKVDTSNDGILGPNSPLYQQFQVNQVLNIDSDQQNVQMCLPNSIVVDEYVNEDMKNLPVNGEIRDDDWHRDYMIRLTNYILKMVEECDSVPEWLAQNPSDYKPQELLGSYKSEIGQEEEKKERPVFFRSSKNQQQKKF